MNRDEEIRIHAVNHNGKRIIHIVDIEPIMIVTRYSIVGDLYDSESIQICICLSARATFTSNMMLDNLCQVEADQYTIFSLHILKDCILGRWVVFSK